MAPNPTYLAISRVVPIHDLLWAAGSAFRNYQKFASEPILQTRSLWDTLDWQIISSGHTLEGRTIAGSEELEMLLARNGTYGQYGTLAAPSNADFARPDLIYPIGFSKRISRLTGGRAILRVAEFEAEHTVLTIQDHLAKQIGSIEFTYVVELHQTWVHSRPKRGYESLFGRSIASIAYYASAQAMMDESIDLWRAILWLRGRKPLDYSPKFAVQLDPSSPFDIAIGKLLAHLLGAAKWNLDGMYRDIDTEFVHEFRVAIRRARSIVQASQQRLGRKRATRLQRDLGAAARYAGEVRDLDVALERIKHLPWLDEHEFIGTIEDMRKEALSKLKIYLESKDFDDLLQRWSALALQLITSHSQSNNRLSDHVVPQLEAARSTMVELASDPATKKDPEQLHTLRKKAKQLRYLLEAYASTIDPASASLAIADMKSMQDYLGELQDRATLSSLLTRIGVKDIDPQLFEIPRGVRSALADFTSREADSHWSALIGSIATGSEDGQEKRVRRVR